MAEARNSGERRKHKRFRAREDAYVMLRGPTRKLGQIIDVSSGGLSFRYIDIGERPEKSLVLDISVEDIGFRLKRLAFESIYDLRTTQEFPYSATKMRRRGGRFLGLDQDQVSGLADFMAKHTVGVVSDPVK